MSGATRLSRRRLLQAAVMIAAAALTGCAAMRRDDHPLLRSEDPVARALAYYPDTRNVPAGNPLAATHDASQNCANCLHGRGRTGPGRIDCPKFPRRSVSVDGWCSLWTPGRI